MHEFSLATSLIEKIIAISRENGGMYVQDVYVSIGAMSSVVVESFEFSFNILKETSPETRDARLHIDITMPSYSCSSCGYTIEGQKLPPRSCNRCNNTSFFPTGGDDIILMRLELGKAN